MIYHVLKSTVFKSSVSWKHYVVKSLYSRMPSRECGPTMWDIATGNFSCHKLTSHWWREQLALWPIRLVVPSTGGSLSWSVSACLPSFPISYIVSLLVLHSRLLLQSVARRMGAGQIIMSLPLHLSLCQTGLVTQGRTGSRYKQRQFSLQKTAN